MLWYLGTQEQSRRSKKKKRGKYQDLRIELKRLWDKPVEIVPLIIGAIGDFLNLFRFLYSEENEFI